MIAARITDGLGNQLFQYAAARRLSVVHDSPLLLDTSWYKRHSHRRYELDRFNLTAQPLRLRELRRICPGEALLRWLPERFGQRGARIPLALLRRAGLQPRLEHRSFNYKTELPRPPLLRGRVLTERQFHFDPDVLSAPDNVAMCGYWQSERYFADVEEVIRGDLAVKQPLSGDNLASARQIESCNSVSLHVRRGDKVNWSLFHCTTLQFCEAAVRWFEERVSSPRFFVFSDDPEWVQEYISGLADVIIVEHNGPDRAAEDLRLMSLCQHNIIASSSFSWWGAWLNPNPNKIVVSPHPQYWINDKRVVHDDFIPADWVIIDEARFREAGAEKASSVMSAPL